MTAILPMHGFDQHTQEIVRQGVSLWHAGLFFEAHESFESGFRVATGAERTLLHALAQLSASYHQLTLGRARAAVRTFHKARDKLAALGLLSSEYERQAEEFWAQLGVSAEHPRFIRVEDLPPRESWPFPEYLTSPSR